MTGLYNAKYHILAILTVAVWGTTFISTKVLINNGLTPHEIFFIRFVIAYIGIWFISPRRIFSECVKDELTLLAAGLTGGTLYFITENTALQFTQTTNVAFIICITPTHSSFLTSKHLHFDTVFNIFIFNKNNLSQFGNIEQMFNHCDNFTIQIE